MNRSQKYISMLLERLPKWELRSYEHQTSLDRIRDRISSSSDIQKELLTLYQVRDFSDFALTLMWIADKVEKDTSMEESTLIEETMVFKKFRIAMGDTTLTEQEIASPDIEPSLPGIEFQTPPPSVSVPTPEILMDSTWSPAPEPKVPAHTAGGFSASGRDQEKNFSGLLEKFLESVQSGNDDRTELMSKILNECGTIMQGGLAVPEFKTFCELLVEFLQYIAENQFLDDVRVMNIVSNIQDPVAQWTQSDQPDRSNMIEQAIDILRDFKTMFE